MTLGLPRQHLEAWSFSRVSYWIYGVSKPVESLFKGISAFAAANGREAILKVPSWRWRKHASICLLLLLARCFNLRLTCFSGACGTLQS